MSEYTFGMGDVFFITGDRTLWTERPGAKEGYAPLMRGETFSLSDETVVVMDTVTFKFYDEHEKTVNRMQAVMLMTTRGFGWCWACDIQEHFMATKLAQEKNK